MLKYFIGTWNILLRFGTFCNHLVHFSGFGIMYQDKSGNPAFASSRNAFLIQLEPILRPGANPETFDITATTPAL
jgi:hypothetical protein